MVENKSSLFGIIAIIIGAAGLGIGTLSIVNFQVIEGPQGPPGQDGDDGIDGIDGIDGVNGTDLLPEASSYYCSSATEVQDALDTIGSGAGIIFITEDINVTSTIQIDGGGSYIIQGLGTTINVDGNTEPIQITNATFCTIRDLIIYETEYSTWDRELININEINDNPVYIENIQMYCTTGTGVLIWSDNVFVSDCSFNQNFRAVYVLGDYAHIYQNIANSCSSGVQSYGVFQLSGDNNVLESNTIIGTVNSGSISCTGDNNIIANNVIERSNENAIKIFYGANNSVTGNFIKGYAHYINEGGAFTNPLSGIFVANQAHYNSISGNYIVNMQNTHGSYDGHGIYIWTGCEYTSIIGNTIINNDVNITNNGQYTMIQGNIA